MVGGLRQGASIYVSSMYRKRVFYQSDKEVRELLLFWCGSRW